MAQTIEHQIRACIRDAANRSSRKPFQWGGLTGYQQLEAISEALHEVPMDPPEMRYLQHLLKQVDDTLELSRELAEDVSGAQQQLFQIAQCLGYPTPHQKLNGMTQQKNPRHYSDADLCSAKVRQEMDALLQTMKSSCSESPAMTALDSRVQKRWQTYGPSLLHCYDIPGLPPDNLQLEAVFGSLRHHARRITGRKSTRELRDFGQYQILFTAESVEDLLNQIQKVPIETYKAQRDALLKAEAPHRLARQLHRDPIKAIRSLLSQYPNAQETQAAQTTK